LGANDCFSVNRATSAHGREGEAVGVSFRPSRDSSRVYCDKVYYRLMHTVVPNCLP
jgi:hypothetical protein